MPRKRYNLSLDTELVEQAKVAAGDVSFSRFTERALEAALENRGGSSSGREPGDETTLRYGRAPAPPRASRPPISAAKLDRFK